MGAGQNPGTILLGVADDGDLVGLGNTASSEQRDELLRRIEGICRGTIKPAITPTVSWAVETKLNVLVIQVPKGTEPIYYSNNIPYVRHLSESRPAEPHEVIDRVRTWLATQVEQEENPFNELLGQLASLLIEAIIFAEETEERRVNPWLDQWRAQYEYTATRLREIAADTLIVEHGLSDDLNGLAAKLNAVSSFRLYIGCGPEFDILKQEAVNSLREVKRKHIDTIPLSDASLAAAKETIQRIHRQLEVLCARMVDMANQGQIDQVRTEASNFGFTLLKLSHYPIDGLHQGLSRELGDIGRQLHLVETTMLRLDGGRSVQEILDRITASTNRLRTVVESLA